MNKIPTKVKSLVVREVCGTYAGKQVEAPADGMEFFEVLDAVKEGLPLGEFEALQGMLEIGAEELAEHLSMSRSTLMRRRKSGRLDTLESDRLLRFARLYQNAVEVFGDEQSARIWLKSPARALGGAAPIICAGTEVGSREVEHLLGRIEFGVFT